MQLIIVTIFYLLISTCAYAADISDTYAAEKKEEGTIPANNILTLSEPTEGGIREYQLDLNSDDLIKYTPYEYYIAKENKKGMPSFFCIYTDIEGNKEHRRAYNWQFLRKWFTKQSTDPFTRKPINSNNLSYFLIRILPNTKPLAYAATFLFTGDDANTNVKPLNETLDYFKKEHETTLPEVTLAAFYTSLINKYYIENPEPTQSHRDLALQFAQFGLEGIPNKPEGILKIRESFFIRKAAEICLENGDIDNAIAHYRKAINVNDSFSFNALSELCNRLGNNYRSQHIQLLEEKAKAETDPFILEKIQTSIIPLYEAMGNTEAVSAARQKIKDLDNMQKSLKRERDSSPIREQKKLEAPRGPSKRARRV